MVVLVLDVGGTHVKIAAMPRGRRAQLDSGPRMTPEQMVAAVRAATRGWRYDAVSIGYPGVVRHGRITHEPHHLGAGWVGFDFAKAFGRPVQLVNDAAMQALGSYRGRGMLFLGLGTGLGSAMIVDGVLAPLELAHLPYRRGRTFEQYVGLASLERLGRRRWRHFVWDVVPRLEAALEVDEVVLGGGNARLLQKLPSGVSRGDNRNAFRGGYRLWAPPARGRHKNPGLGQGAMQP